MATNQYWGTELIVNCTNCDRSKVTDEKIIRSFIKELIEEIKMVSWNDPLIQHFETPNPNLSGWSFCQMITTSAITAHFIDESGNAFINIFSCKEFNENDAIKVIQKYFNPEKISTTCIDRISP